ncbi:MAG: hypothetical protein ACRDVP_04345 [Acidimicrobiales bacterium]
MTDDGALSPNPRPGGRRHPASDVRLLPPTYVPMTPEQEERAVEALAGLLAEAEQRRDGRDGPARAAP